MIDIILLIGALFILLLGLIGEIALLAIAFPGRVK